MQKIDTQLRQAVEESVERRGAHLIDLVVRGERGTRVVEVFIDAMQSVSSDLCADVSREVASAIDGQSLIDGAYRLNVSSPGIERPLKYAWQYQKHAGRMLQVTVRGQEGEGRQTGRLVSVDDTQVVLDPGGGKDPVAIPFETVIQAVVKAPW